MYTFGGNVPVLTIVVPCYNEEEVLQETASRLLQIMHELISSAIVSE
jgi:cellulose synthase/poly-beta-1,6-N-acetylglucosamine synthase-like glycosyltransferase